MSTSNEFVPSSGDQGDNSISGNHLGTQACAGIAGDHWAPPGAGVSAAGEKNIIVADADTSPGQPADKWQIGTHALKPTAADASGEPTFWAALVNNSALGGTKAGELLGGSPPPPPKQ